MPRILLVGQDPATVDFSNPALPPGLSAEVITAGIASVLKDMAERGWEGVSCLVLPDATAGATVARYLADAAYDCVVIGGGIRIPPQSLWLFEMVINVVHRNAPGAVIAFNTRPEESAEAAARAMKLA